MEMIILEIYVLVCTLFLAGKDATSYLLKDTLIIIPIIYLRPELHWIILYTVLIRLAIFDIAFNKWAGLDYRFLGSTAFTDKFFIKIFGTYGAVKKSIFFLVVLLILNIFLK